MSEISPFLPGLSPVDGKPLTTNRDAGNLPSNGGLLVLREAALKLALAFDVLDDFDRVGVADTKCLQSQTLDEVLAGDPVIFDGLSGVFNETIRTDLGQSFCGLVLRWRPLHSAPAYLL